MITVNCKNVSKIFTEMKLKDDLYRLLVFSKFLEKYFVKCKSNLT